MISTVAGTSTDAARFTTADTLYIDWAVINQGQAATGATFYTRLLLNGTAQKSWYTSPPLKPNWYTYAQDFAIAPLAAGTYTLTIQADSDNAIVESNETNNSYSRSFTVVALNQPPVIDSLSDSPDPATVGRDGHFDGERRPRPGWDGRQCRLLP